MSTADPSIPAAAAEVLRERASSRWMDLASDWFNPILVKEVRQSLKSRQFVVTFMLLLVGAWLVSFLSIMWMGNAIEYGSVAPRIFWWFYLVLAVAMFVIVPFSAFRSLLAERDENTFDLLSITTLSPRQIVQGKLLSSLVQLFIFYSAVAPFVAFTSMLKGFSLPEVAYVLGLSMLVSVLACSTCLMASTLVRSRTWQGLVSLAVLIGLITLFSIFAVWDFGRHAGIVGVVVDNPLPAEPVFWWAHAVGFSIAASYFVLFHQVTTARLTFESGNRSTGLRVTCYVQLWLVWGSLLWLLVYLAGRYPELRMMQFSRSLDQLGPVLVSLSLVQLGLLGLFASTEPEDLSRRLLRSVPSRGLFKFLVVPWLPGCGRGFAFVLLALGSLLAIVVTATAFAHGEPIVATAMSVLQQSTSSGGELVQFTACGCCYVVVYCGVGCLLLRLLGGENEIRPSHVRVVVLLVALFAIIVPYMIRSFGVRAFRRYSLLLVSVPFDTLGHIRRSGEYADAAALVLMTSAALVVTANIPGLVRAFTEVAQADPRRLKRIDDARHVTAPFED